MQKVSIGTLLGSVSGDSESARGGREKKTVENQPTVPSYKIWYVCLSSKVHITKVSKRFHRLVTEKQTKKNCGRTFLSTCAQANGRVCGMREEEQDKSSQSP